MSSSVPQQTCPLGQSVLSSHAIDVPVAHAMIPAGSQANFGLPLPLHEPQQTWVPAAHEVCGPPEPPQWIVPPFGAGGGAASLPASGEPPELVEPLLEVEPLVPDELDGPSPLLLPVDPEELGAPEELEALGSVPSWVLPGMSNSSVLLAPLHATTPIAVAAMAEHAPSRRGSFIETQD